MAHQTAKPSALQTSLSEHLLQIGLGQMLEAYESVLMRHGLNCVEDSFFYQLLLSLSLQTGHSWRSKFRSLCQNIAK